MCAPRRERVSAGGEVQRRAARGLAATVRAGTGAKAAVGVRTFDSGQSGARAGAIAIEARPFRMLLGEMAIEVAGTFSPAAEIVIEA